MRTSVTQFASSPGQTPASTIPSSAAFVNGPSESTSRFRLSGTNHLTDTMDGPNPRMRAVRASVATSIPTWCFAARTCGHVHLRWSLASMGGRFRGTVIWCSNSPRLRFYLSNETLSLFPSYVRRINLPRLQATTCLGYSQGDWSVAAITLSRSCLAMSITPHTCRTTACATALPDQ